MAEQPIPRLFLALMIITTVLVALPVAESLLLASVFASLLWPAQQALARRLRGRRGVAAGLLTAGVVVVLLGPVATLGAPVRSTSSRRNMRRTCEGDACGVRELRDSRRAICPEVGTRPAARGAMNLRSRHSLGALTLWMVAACGSGQPVAKAPPPATQHKHPKLPAGVEAFHDLLSPIWHAEPGETRVKRACDQAAALGEHARALVIDPTPAEAQDKVEVWKLATDTLAAQVTALVAACGVEGKHEVEAKLMEVHEGFHKVASTVAEMGDHGDARRPGGTGEHGGPGER